MHCDLLSRHSLRRFVVLPVMFAVIAVLFSGCGEDEEVTPTSLGFVGSPVLAGALNQPLPFSLRLQAYGTGVASAQRIPAPHANVILTIIEQPEGAQASIEPAETATDAGGIANARFTTGSIPGVYRIQAHFADHPEIEAQIITVLGGVILIGDGQDGWVGSTLVESIGVRLESAPGVFFKAGEGLVRFDLRSAPGNVKLTAEEAPTDSDGFASIEVMLGKAQGLGEVGITILSGIPGADYPGMFLPLHFFAMDGTNLTLSILGGVALFIFGMHLMSDGLQRVAGDKLRSILNALTKNRFLAVGAGATVTAIIQSSTACTVMVVGFVNAGIIRLEQAIGVVMGANIGTTLTAQIIALKLSSLALPAISIGVIVTMAARRQVIKQWGGILIGFGILFLGMNIMGDKMGELKDSATMVSLFQNFNCMPEPGGFVPVVQFIKAIGVGLGVTLVLQSSAATIGMLIVVAATGLIDPFAAFGILLGDNLGTTLTAVLASLGSGSAAKRAACFHVMFNSFGTIIMIFLLFVSWPGQAGRPVFLELVNIFTPGDIFRGENLPRFLANAHTLFNTSCTLLFLPFVPKFAALCRIIVKENADEKAKGETRQVLEPHLLANPAFAMQQVWAEVSIMLSKGREAQAEGFKTITSADTPDWDHLAKTARSLEQETDELQAAVTTYLTYIPMSGLNENQSVMFPRMLRTVNEAERLGDLGRHLSKLGKRVKKRSLPFTPECVDEMKEMTAVVDEIILLAEKSVEVNADGIETSGGGASLRTRYLDEGKRLNKIAKDMSSSFRKNHEKRHEAGHCDIRSGVVFLDVVNTLARSSGHALNVIEAACLSTARSVRR